MCELVKLALNTRINGFHKRPANEQNCLSNIRKALESLRTEKSMSKKFTWKDSQILEGERQIILGLLEDIHRFMDKLPPRPFGANYFNDGPYTPNFSLDNIKKPISNFIKVENDKIVF